MHAGPKQAVPKGASCGFQKRVHEGGGVGVEGRICYTICYMFTFGSKSIVGFLEF